MRFKGIIEQGVGFIFKGLNEDVQYEVFKERTQGKFKTLIYGLCDNGTFHLDYSPKLNYLLITYVETDNDVISKIRLFLYTNLKEALEDFKQLENKKDSRWWNTKYYETDFIQDYIEPGDYSKMKWKKKGVLWVAQGNNGKFSIRHLHRKYIGRYDGKNGFTFNMPPTPTISKMKDNCKHNAYWEG